ncbi:MAG: PH domain-containing protein [Anaerolineales bacterium]|nr:PH domain-containing protein [Anaerolineales bacterium]
MGYIESLLAENEVIVVQTRQHWIVWAKSFAVNAFFLIVIVVLAVLATVSVGPLGIAIVFLAILPIGAFLKTYLDWWNEEYLVTNRRVIQSEGIINKHVIDSSLEKVNDVVLDQSVFGRMFDYGDIEILTASEGGVNKLHKIASPVKFKTEMLNQKEAMGTDERIVGRADHPADIPGLIAGLDALRQRGILTEAEFQQKKAELLSKM